MKLENMCDVIKTNLSEGCGGPTYVANCIRKNETSLNIYCESESYDEFEQRILKEGPTNVVYCIVSRCGKDRENHYERIKKLFTENSSPFYLETYSDIAGVLVGNKDFQTIISNNYGDGMTEIAVFKKGDTRYDFASKCMWHMMGYHYGPTLRGKFNIYPYDCCSPKDTEPCVSLDGEYITCAYDGFVAFVEQ